MKLKDILLLGAVTTATACGSSSTGPSVQPPAGPEAPILNCPADVTVTAHNGLAPTVSFDTPEVLLGAPPIAVVCTPASGTKFPNGTTAVTCEATDALMRRAGCNFSVFVTPIPQLLKAPVKFLAFGDSLTEGKTSLVGPGAVAVPPGVFNTSVSYVEQLSTKLGERYQDQTTTVVADGLGGESTGTGKLRLPGDLSTYNPDALLLMEGTNDMLFTPDNSGIQSAIDALQNMVRQAKSRGARVFLATLLPMDPARRGVASATGVNTLNGRIRQLAVTENVTLVDLNAAVPLTLIGSDGVHPKAGAYDLMAQEWLNAIIATMEVK